MFQGQLGMVSPWMDHGTLAEYIQKHDDADRYELVSRYTITCLTFALTHEQCLQVAAGVRYLHNTDMVCLTYDRLLHS
jgi:hypothetical protein